MKKALIYASKVIQIELTEFPVAPPLLWVVCPDVVQVGWTYNGTAFIEPTQPETPPTTQFTPLEFLAKFTQSEQLAVVTATLQSPALKLWYDMMLAASFVDTRDQRTIDGLTALVTAGLISQQRKIEILTP